MNYLESLPQDLRFYIAEFVPSKPVKPLPFIDEYQNVLLDWYNKYRVTDNSVYLNYKQLYDKGIESYEVQYIKYGFFWYAKDVIYYNLFIDYHTGQFRKIAKCNTNRQNNQSFYVRRNITMNPWNMLHDDLFR
jgi:hypothetical protein